MCAHHCIALQGYSDNFHTFILGITGLYTVINKMHIVQLELLEIHCTLFVMLRCLVSKPFNTKLSIRFWDWRLPEQTVVFWHTVKLSGEGRECRLLCCIWLYCNLHIILLQMICDLWCLDGRSRILSTQSFSLDTVHLVLPQHTACLMSTLLAVSSRHAQDWGNKSGLSGWVSSPSIVVSALTHISWKRMKILMHGFRNKLELSELDQMMWLLNAYYWLLFFSKAKTIIHAILYTWSWTRLVYFISASMSSLVQNQIW